MALEQKLTGGRQYAGHVFQGLKEKTKQNCEKFSVHGEKLNVDEVCDEGFCGIIINNINNYYPTGKQDVWIDSHLNMLCSIVRHSLSLQRLLCSSRLFPWNAKINSNLQTVILHKPRVLQVLFLTLYSVTLRRAIRGQR